MERVEGRPDLSSADSPEEARAVLDEFVDLLARMHQIDVRQLGNLELKIPENAEEVALGDLGHWIRFYRERKVRPAPPPAEAPTRYSVIHSRYRSRRETTVGT